MNATERTLETSKGAWTWSDDTAIDGMAGVDGKAGNFSRLRGFPPLLQNLDSDTNFRHSDDVTITSKYCMSE